MTFRPCEFGLVCLLLVLLACTWSVEGHGVGHKHERGEYHSDILAPRAPSVRYGCDYDEFEARRAGLKRIVDQKREYALPLERDAASVTPQPLRILVVGDNLVNDAGTCYSAGQSVPIDSGGSYTCTSDDILTSSKANFLNNTILNYAVNRFAELLYVNRTYTKLTVAPSSDSGCDSVTVTMPQWIIDNGADADFILLVTARPIPSGSSSLKVLAHARTCQTLSGTGRPIVGWADFDPSALDETDPSKLPMQAGTAIHEISHSLGYNFGAWSSLGMVALDPGDTTDTKYRMIDPGVTAYVQEHFNCSSLTGALLEDLGGSGTQKSHWEKATFMNEYMTGEASNEMVVSALTLLSFQGTGWYQADLSKADAYYFGWGAGCGMSASWTGCNNWPASYSCDATSSVSSACSAGLGGYGPCVTEPSGSIIGVGCTYYEATTTCNMPFAPGSPQAMQSSGALGGLQNSGQTFATDSRCYTSTLNQVASLSQVIPVPSTPGPACYRSHCSATDELRLFVEDTYYPCTPEGTSVTPTGYGGSITCPAGLTEPLCRFEPYDAEWPRILNVAPLKATPSSAVSVNYTGATGDLGVSIQIEMNCSNNQVAPAGEVTGDLAPEGDWGSPRYLNIFNTKLNVILRDSNGRTDVMYSAFQADVGFGLAYLEALWTWMKANPLFTVLACIAIVLPCAILIFCCYRKCCKKKSPKPNRMQYQSSYGRANDDYYFGDELDDVSHHKAPAPISR